MFHRSNENNRNSTLPSRAPETLLLLALATLPSCAPNPAPQPTAATPQATSPQRLPPSFTVQEKFFAIGTDTTIQAGGTTYGRIDQKILSWGTAFTYYDNTGVKIASAKQRVLSWGVQIDIFDNNDVKIGSVREDVLKNLFSIKSHYTILDASDNVIARSAKLDWLATDIKVKTEAGATVAHMHRPAIDFGGATWSVTISEEIDPRLVIFIPSYKTAADNSRK